MLFLMLIGHAIADGPLQPGWLSRDKRHEWWQIRWSALGFHGSVHGFFVMIFTGRPELFFAELVTHVAIDYAKSRGRLSMEADQALHVVCKIVWAFYVFS